jgi:hypothetical protein
MRAWPLQSTDLASSQWKDHTGDEQPDVNGEGTWRRRCMPLELPARPRSKGYVWAPMESQTLVPDHAGRC